MSIDARIAAVTVLSPTSCDLCNLTGRDPEDKEMTCPACHGATKDNPKVILKLEARERFGCAGQNSLTITNPPTVDPNVLSALVGLEIWGGSGYIMIGEKKWADRISYTSIKLLCVD